MMDDRIEQFRKMAQANPEDDLAHFALGNALVEAERYAEAIPVLRHVVKINASYSRLRASRECSVRDRSRNRCH